MGALPISQSATTAREAARDKSDGQFGTQSHADSGVVDVRPLSIDVDLVMANIFASPADEYDDDEFPGFRSDSFHSQVERVRNAIWDVENLTPRSARSDRTFAVEFPVDASGENDQALVGFTIHKGGTHLRVLRAVDVDELTDDQDASGQDAARGIAVAMIRQMDQATADYEELR